MFYYETRYRGDRTESTMLIDILSSPLQVQGNESSMERQVNGNGSGVDGQQCLCCSCNYLLLFLLGDRERQERTLSLPLMLCSPFVRSRGFIEACIQKAKLREQYYLLLFHCIPSCFLRSCAARTGFNGAQILI